MHEIFWYNENTNKLINLFRPCYRLAIHKALTNSSSYLYNTEIKRNKKGQIRHEPLTATTDDVSIVYQLYIQAPKKINTLQWYRAFCEVVDVANFDDIKLKKINRIN